MLVGDHDRPLHDRLDVEDDEFSPERLRAYEDAQLAHERTVYRVIARERATGALAGQMLVRLSLDGEKVTGEERLLTGLQERIRDVRQGPDGYIYVATELGSGGNSPDGTVLKIEPADAPTSSAAK